MVKLYQHKFVPSEFEFKGSESLSQDSSPKVSQSRSSFGDFSEKKSLYQLALATGVDEMMDVYRNAILQAEEEILSDPLPRVSIISKHMEIVRTLPQIHISFPSSP